jgi:hypothetical protein
VRVLLAVGSAPCFAEDLAAARDLYPLSETMTINGACQLVEQAEHLLAGHTDKAEFFAAARRRTFPHADPVRVHANWTDRHRPPPKAQYPSVTDWWPPEVSSGATSAGKAARIGLLLGFDRIVLCGCPMDGSGYAPGESDGIPQLAAVQRVGDSRKQKATTIRRYYATMEALAKTTFKGRVFSMSGKTREWLGAP